MKVVTYVMAGWFSGYAFATEIHRKRINRERKRIDSEIDFNRKQILKYGVRDLAEKNRKNLYGEEK